MVIQFTGVRPRPYLAYIPVSPSTHKPVTHTAPIRFSGQPWQGTGKNGLWVSLELAPYSVVGGLGQVTETIPEALNAKLKKDVRVMVPLLAGMAQSPDFQPTGWETQLVDSHGRLETFKLFERNTPGKPIVYAIANDTYFGKHKNIYFPSNVTPEGIGKDAIFKAIAMYNRVAAVFTDRLQEASIAKQADKPYQAGPTLYEGPMEFVLVHDWLSSPYLNELKPQTRDALGKVFMLHNTYNEVRPVEVAKQNHLRTSPRQRVYSPLSIGIAQADAVIGNRNYTQRITSILNPKAPYSPMLREKLSTGQLFDMHHGLASRYNAFETPLLHGDGFSNLDMAPLAEYLARPAGSRVEAPVAARREMHRFKQTNKVALQTLLGLPRDANAPLFSWVARPEPYQKGFYMVMATVIPFLKAHPEAQMILAGPQPGSGNLQVDAFLKQITGDPDLNRRVSIMGFVDYQKVIRVHSGADFVMHPSLYEPYGLVQLETMSLGSLPIVNLVDGLKSTVSDPTLNRRRQAGQTKPSERETVWQYGQNGIAMGVFHPLRYWKGLNNYMKDIPTAQAEFRRANALFRDALERAYAVTQKPDTLSQWRLNGLRYVRQNHDWDVITPRYEAPIQYAISQAKARLSTDRAESVS